MDDATVSFRWRDYRHGNIKSLCPRPLIRVDPTPSEGEMQNDKLEQIRKRAYDIWEAEGRAAGNDEDHC